jgi:hypothetical protein
MCVLSCDYCCGYDAMEEERLCVVGGCFQRVCKGSFLEKP